MTNKRKMQINNKIAIFLSLALVLILFTSCNHDRKTPGAQYLDDMVTPISYEDYSINPVFKNGMTEQLPVEGTVARGKMSYVFEKTADGQKLAGEQLVNPFKTDAEILKIGARQYGIYCIICHGSTGKGNGTLFESGKFTAQPTNLTEERIVDLPEGEIYHIITKGSVSGLMGAHASQIKSENRWKIIKFIKNNFSVKVKK